MYQKNLGNNDGLCYQFLDTVRKALSIKNFNNSFELVWRKWKISNDTSLLYNLCQVLGLAFDIESIIYILSLITDVSNILIDKKVKNIYSVG